MLKIIQIFKAFAAVCLFSFNAEAWRESFGGNSEIAEFKNIGFEVGLYLSKSETSNQSILNNFSEAVENAVITCGDNLNLDGIPKDAINYPYSVPQKIELNCIKWIKVSSQSKLGLVIHEVLPLLNLDDADYSMSSQILNRFKDYKSKSSVELDYFFESLMSCNISNFNTSVSYGINYFASDSNDSSSLGMAVGSGCTEIASSLLSMGVYPGSDMYMSGQNLIFDLIRQSHATLVESLFFYNQITIETETFSKQLKLINQIIKKYPHLLNEQFLCSESSSVYGVSCGQKKYLSLYEYINSLKNYNSLNLQSSRSFKVRIQASDILILKIKSLSL